MEELHIPQMAEVEVVLITVVNPQATVVLVVVMVVIALEAKIQDKAYLRKQIKMVVKVI